MIRRPRLSILAGVIVLTAMTISTAEVSTDPAGQFVNTLVLGTITDDPDPVGIWSKYRDVAPNRVLNPGGDLRGDGRPDLAIVVDDPDPVGYRPLVVWAYNNGYEFDIAFSEWDGATWTPTVFLTTSTADERDPRLFVEDDGTTHVVWWTVGASEEIYLATRPAGSTTWGQPVLVTTLGETGRRPSVAVLEGMLFVAYERDSTTFGMAQDVRIARRLPSGGFTHETVGSTTRTEALDAVLHVEQGHLWTDWKDDVSEFGCSEYLPGNGWSSNDSAPWADPSWIGIEETRKLIQRQVLE